MSLNNTAAIVFAIVFMLANVAFAQRQPLALPSPEAGTLSNMPFASTPFDGSELIYVVQGGISKKTNLLTALEGDLPFLAAGNTATRKSSSAQRALHQLSIIDDFANVYGDAVYYLANVACTSGSPVITLTQAGSNPVPALTSADVGKVFDALGCGGAYWAFSPVSITAAGTGYVFGETITFAGGMKGRVVGTNASDGLSAGAATSTILVNPGAFTGAAPANSFAQVSTTGAGTGLTISVGGFNSALSSTIVSVNTGTQQITLAANATQTQAATQQLIAYGHDDEPGYLAALQSITANTAAGGVTLRIPAPSGMGYLFAEPLILPAGQARITGDDKNSVIVAGAPMLALIETPTPGGIDANYSLEHFTLEGATVAIHDFWQQKQAPTLDHMWLYDAASGGTNFATTDAGTYINGNLQTSWLENQVAYYANVNQLPSIVEDANGSDGHYINNHVIRSSYAEIYDSKGHLANKHIDEHPFGAIVSGGSTIPSALYNIVTGDAGVFIGNELDTAANAGIFTAGFGAIISSNKCIVNSAVVASEPACIEIGKSVDQNIIVGNSATSKFTNVVVQDGTGAPSTTTTIIGNTGGSNPPYSYINALRINTISVFATMAIPGNHPTISGTCSASVGTVKGGYTTGELDFTGACAGTVILTFPSTLAAGTGWACGFSDLTTPSDAMQQTARTTLTVTATGTAANGDVVQFRCGGY